MKKPRVADLAKASGLSVATVDRALNGRLGVSVSAREKVARAVQDLRYGELPQALVAPARPRLKLKFILPSDLTSFSEAILRAVKEAPSAVDDVRVTIDIQHVDIEAPDKIVKALDDIDVAIHPGVALFAVDIACVGEAIDRLVLRGGKVVSLVTDNARAARHHFVGIDNLSAGRVAGNIMGRFLSGQNGRVAVVLGSLTMRDQHDRYLGFTSVLADRFPRLRPLAVSEGYSKADLNRSLVRRLLKRHEDLVGIYSAGAGNSGILDALEEAQLDRHLTVILHELSSRVAQSLKAGMVDAVISQNAGQIARSAVRVLKAHCFGIPVVKAMEQIRIDIYLADNLP